MRNRRIWAAVFAAIMIFTLVGCGKKPVKNNDMDFDTPTTDGYDKETEESGEGQMDETSDSDYEKETDKPTEAPTTKPEDEATETPTTKPADKPTEVPTTKPVVKPTEAPTTKPVVKPTEAPTTKPVVKPTEPPTTKPVVKPTEPTTTKPVVKPTEPPTTKPVEKPTQGQTTRTPVVVTKPVTTYPEIQQGYSEVTEADILTVRNIIRSILYTDMSTIERIKTVHDYLVKNTKYDTGYYDKDDSEEQLSNILNEKRAVCQGYAVAFYIFMNELDIPCSLVSGDAGEDHAWNAVKMDNEWYMIDVTWDDPLVDPNPENDIDESTSDYPNGENLTYTYFLCTKTFMDESHTPNKYVGITPDVYGTSVENNNYPYYQMGYKGIYRIYTLDDLGCISSMTQSGDYMFFNNSDEIDAHTIMGKITEYVKSTNRGADLSFRYGSVGLIASIEYKS